MKKPVKLSKKALESLKASFQRLLKELDR